MNSGLIPLKGNLAPRLLAFASIRRPDDAKSGILGRARERNDPGFASAMLGIRFWCSRLSRRQLCFDELVVRIVTHLLAAADDDLPCAGFWLVGNKQCSLVGHLLLRNDVTAALACAVKEASVGWFP